jgi:hypothetical protein
VLDGAYVARRLNDVEAMLNGPVLDELHQERPRGAECPVPPAA